MSCGPCASQPLRAAAHLQRDDKSFIVQTFAEDAVLWRQEWNKKGTLCGACGLRSYLTDDRIRKKGEGFKVESRNIIMAVISWLIKHKHTVAGSHKI